ncbi:MAG: serine/threonine-protein kinase [Bradymonadia bacterium]
MHLQPPTSGFVIDGRYQIVDHIASGGVGAIYRAVQQPIGRVVAVKLLSQEIPPHSNGWDRFRREAQVLSLLRHPHIVSCLDAGAMPNGQPYLIMEYVPGQTLSDLLEGEPLSIDEIMAISRQIALALAGAHAAGITHRDLSPDNVLIDAQPGMPRHVRLIDFGLAGLTRAMQSHLGGPDLTAPGTRMGTPWYTPPEQSPGPKGDLYSLGVIMFEMLTGQVPFSDRDPVALRMAHTWSAPPEPQSVSTRALPPALCALTLALLAKKPANRPHDAVMVAESIRQLTHAHQPVDEEQTIVEHVVKGELTEAPSTEFQGLKGLLARIMGKA